MDIFLCFERARRLSRTDSQVFEDFIELQSHFYQTRTALSVPVHLKVGQEFRVSKETNVPDVNHRLGSNEQAATGVVGRDAYLHCGLFEKFC